MSEPLNADIARAIEIALDEDLRLGPDITTQATVAANQQGRALIVAREPGAIAGVPVAVDVLYEVASRLGEQAQAKVIRQDGSHVAGGEAILEITGSVRVILSAERTMLNFLGQLSGVATATARWVKALDDTRAKVRDTRKTVPGLRSLQKYAVRCGGGENHRMALGDVALIKDNHVLAAGGVHQAFQAVRRQAPNIPVEVEVDNLDQLGEAIAAGANLVLLDNFTLKMMRKAVDICRKAGVKTEASGGLTEKDARKVAETGVDYISVGALTHSSKVLDLGLDLQSQPA